MSEAGHADWDERHRGKPAGEAEPFLVEMLARIPRGVALDVAAGRGRNALALARAGMQVVAVDYLRRSDAPARGDVRGRATRHLARRRKLG